MKDEEEKIPPFIQDYLNKMDHEGYLDFVKLSRGYHQAREDYPGKFATQAVHLKDFNRATGQKRELNYDDGLKRIDADFKREAYKTARQHGYTGPDPNQPSDKEFTKQGEKFLGMIDHAKQRQQEQTQRPEQKQHSDQSHEKKNVEALNEKQPYQQNQAKVEFKGVQQKEGSGTEQQGREQQRAAFLQKIEKTREQQPSRQQDKQREI